MPREKTPIVPPVIVDRAAEWAELKRLWNSRTPELVFVVGRRRVGKSFLLSHFAEQVGGFYYQATRRTASEQLAALSRQAGEHFRDTALQQGVPFPHWDAFFSYLGSRASRSRQLLVLDELPYLTAAAPEFTSVLQSHWDHTFRGSHLKIILSGSHISTMKLIEGSEQPLYGRRTGRLRIAPFDYSQVPEFVPRYNPLDWIRTYGVFGGLPGHLALLDKRLSLAANVARSMLSQFGRLVDEAEHMLDSFVGEAEVHYSILQAVAQGDRTWSRLTSRIGKSGGALLRPIQWLEDMEILSREVPITETRPERSRRPRYRINDSYLSFWHRLVSPLICAGSIGLADPRFLWREKIAPQLDQFMGPVFEEVCREFVRRGDADKLPFKPLRVGAWWNRDGTEEVDIVSLGARGTALVAECKWGRVTHQDLRNLRRRAGLLTAELKGVRRVYYALFSGRGIGDRVLRDAVEQGDVLHFAVKDLF